MADKISAQTLQSAKGKSLCAKMVASSWNLPLLKVDPAKMYDKYIGETEKNLARATATAEKMSPVVL